MKAINPLLALRVGALLIAALHIYLVVSSVWI